MLRINSAFWSLGLFLVGLAPPAVAQRGDPGSLLLYPEFDSNPGALNLVSVTNVDSTLDVGPVTIKWEYIGGDSCQATAVIETLNPSDTLTVVASAHSQVADHGYLTIHAVNAGQQPIVHNQLIGTSTMIDGIAQRTYSIEPYSFRGLGGNFPGALTDVNGNGRRDLNGVEYTPVGDRYMIPRYLGQSASLTSRLIMIDLTAGSRFTTTTAFLVYNDNGEVFSTEQSFICWDEFNLLTISSIFDNNFLQSFTNQDPNEILGDPSLEAGWMQMQGAVAIDNLGLLDPIFSPAILVMFIEEHGNGTTYSTPPAYVGTRNNASLLPDGANQVNGGAQ